MSFTVKVNQEGVLKTLRFKLLPFDTIIRLLRDGLCCKGGFLFNSTREVVFEIAASEEYTFEDFVVLNNEQLIAAPEVEIKPMSNSTANKDIGRVDKVQSEQFLVKDDKTRKNKKKPIDTNAPKPAPTGYLLFCADENPKLKEANPELSNRDRVANIGHLWTDLDPNIKAAYMKRAEELKEQYLIEVALYVQSNPESDLAKTLPKKKVEVYPPVVDAATSRSIKSVDYFKSNTVAASSVAIEDEAHLLSNQFQFQLPSEPDLLTVEEKKKHKKDKKRKREREEEEEEMKKKDKEDDDDDDGEEEQE